MPICKSARRVSGALLSAFLILPVLAGCGGDSAGISPLSLGAAAPSLSDALAELDAQQAPAGTDPAVFDVLKAELKRQLEARQGSQLEKAPPTGDHSAAELSWDEGTATLSWYYFNNGDYDQNGEVSVSDLTPLGVHFGKEVDPASHSVLDDLVSGPDSPPFGLTPVESVVDGDLNGQIGISDITPIGQNFYATVSAYRVYAGTETGDYPAGNDAVSALTPLAEIAFSEAQGTPAGGRLTFSHTVASPVAGMSYWVRPVYGGAEGTPSNVAGGVLSSGSGALALTGVSPSSAEPGQFIWLEFSMDLADQLEELTIVIDDHADLPRRVSTMVVYGNTACSAAPLLGAGQVKIEAFQGATGIGSVSLNVVAAETAVTLPESEQRMESSLAALDGFLLDHLEFMDEQTPDFDLTAAEAELADFNASFSGVVEWFSDEMAALSAEEQTAVLCYLENTGYFALLEMLGEQPATTSRAASHLSYTNWSYLHTDVWSAMATNYSIVADAAGLGIVLASGTSLTMPVVAARLVLSILDNAADTFIPTDLYGLRMKTYEPYQNRLLATGKDLTINVEGRFAAEKPVVNGTIDLCLDVALAGFDITPDFKNELLSEAINTLGAKTVVKLYNVWWNTQIPPIEDPEDPCYGRIGGFWLPLDLHLYESMNWEDIKAKVVTNKFSNWSRDYAQLPQTPHRTVDIDPPFAEYSIESYTDAIRFSHPDKYLVTVSAFSFSDSSSFLLLWSQTGIKEITGEFTFWAGRFGDWKNVTVAADGESEYWYPQYAQVLDGNPTCIAGGGHITRAVDPLGENWSQPSVIEASRSVVDFAVLDGRPALLTSLQPGYDHQLLIANDAAGTDWPADGTPVPITYRCAGTHTGASSGSKLIDASADFFLSGVRVGDWVELTATGSYASVQGISSATELATSVIVGEDTFDGGEAYQVYRRDLKVSEHRCSLGVVGGRPALLYRRHGGSPIDTYFVVAGDAAGQEWQEPLLVGQEQSGQPTSILSVDGAPAYISSIGARDIYYRRALDPLGETWGSLQHVVNLEGVEPGLLRSYAVVAGAPAICYTMKSAVPDNPEVPWVGELYYRRADDPEGTSWAAPVLLGRGNDSYADSYMGDASLAVISGRPGVAFFNLNNCLGYIEALDSTGDSWGEGVEVDIDGSSLQLFEFGAGPAVCYYSSKAKELRFSVPEL